MNILLRSRVPNALYQVSRFPVSELWRRRLSNVFLTYVDMAAILVNSHQPYWINWIPYIDNYSGEIWLKLAQGLQWRSHLKYIFMWPWSKGQRPSINPEVDIFPCFWLIKYLCISLQQFLKHWILISFPYTCKYIRSQFGLCRKFGSQLRIIIWMRLIIGLESSMLYTKFQGSQFLSSGKKVFKRFIPYMFLVATLVSRYIWINCLSPYLRRLNMKYGYNWPNSLCREVIWNMNLNNSGGFKF